MLEDEDITYKIRGCVYEVFREASHEAQLLNYMKATNVELGLLINFTHPKVEIKHYVSN